MRPLGVLLTVLALALSACGGADDDSSGPSEKPSAAEGAPGNVRMKDIAFQPRSIAVERGDTVTWVNEDSVEHDVAATSGADFKSELFGKDGSFEYKTTDSGTIAYVCTVHPGMEGEIVVK